MAFTNSGFPLLNFIDKFDATQMAIDLSLTTHKIALYLNAKSPNFSTDVGYNSTSEASGTGYTAAGKILTGLNPTTTESPTGTFKYDHDDQAWTGASFTAHGSETYADALAGDNIFLVMTYAADFTVTAGTFTEQLSTNGAMTDDCTP